MGRAFAFFFVLSSIGCAPSHAAPAGIICCPLLRVHGPRGDVTYGAIASLDRFARDTCIELYLGDERIAHEHATFEGTFALQFVVPGRIDGRDLDLRTTSAEGVTEHLSLSLTEETGALIDYPEGTTPLIVFDRRLRFRGSLEGDTSDPASEAWMVNWTTGAVAPIVPAPAPSADFEATVAGSRGHCASPASLHAGRAGGCWWPMGGGGCAPYCILEEYEAGMCPPAFGGGSCPSGRGCTIIDVDERRSGSPPPETDHAVVTEPPPPRDGGPDVPDVPVDVPIDVPPDVPSDVPTDVVVM